METEEENVTKFFKVFNVKYFPRVNKIISEPHGEKLRHNVESLPDDEDVEKLYDYVIQERNKTYTELEKTFLIPISMKLAETTLILLQVFNRRRIGEVEKILVKDFQSCMDLMPKSQPSTSVKDSSKDYAMSKIRGKLCSNVPIFVSKEETNILKTIIKYREQVGINAENPYVFGTPHFQKTNAKMDAGRILKKYAEKSGVKDFDKITGTLLRKHFATKCSEEIQNEADVQMLANHMGHHKDIHKRIYRLNTAKGQIASMSRLLQKISAPERKEISDTDDHSDSESENKEAKSDEENFDNYLQSKTQKRKRK